MNTPSDSGSVKHQNQCGSIGIHCVKGTTCFAALKSVQASGEHHHILALVLLPLTLAGARCVHSLTQSFINFCLKIQLGVQLLVLIMLNDLTFSMV